jgi:protein SCO1/2
MNATASKSKVALIVVVGIVAALVGALLAQMYLNRAPAALATGTLLDPPKSIPAFALLDQDGQPFTPSDLQGQWSVIFFGFTNCPDICPTTLTTLNSVHSLLEDIAEQRPQVILVTADAKRDTPEQIKKYVRFFNSTFAAVTGDQPALEAFALSLGAPVAIRPLSDGTYNVDHSGALFIVDPQGALRAIFSGPHQATALAADLRILVGAR